MLNNHHLCLGPKHFHHCRVKLNKQFLFTTHAPHPSAPANHHQSIFCLYGLIYSGYFYTWNQCSMWCFVSRLFTKYVFKVHFPSAVCASSSFLFMAEEYLIVGVCCYLFIRLAVNGHFELFVLSGCCRQCCYKNRHVRGLVWVPVVSFLGVELQGHTILCLTF